MLEIFVLMVKSKEELEKDDKLYMQKYRNDLKWGKEHGFIPKIPLPRWMKK